MKRVFLLGSNIENSLSPFIHNYWLKKYQLDGEYAAITFDYAQAPGFLRNFVKHDFIGGNVTMPFKPMAFYLSDRVESCPINVANTIWLEDNVTIAANSDIQGFEKLLDYHGFTEPGTGNNALILGSGGSSKAVAYVLAKKGYNIYIASRKIAKQQIIKDNLIGIAYSELSQHNFSLLVNTTPCTMQNNTEVDFLAQLQLAEIYKNSTSNFGVIDLIYVPANTKLLEQAKELGVKKRANGMVMLLEQAAYGFEKWFGVKPEVTPELLDILQEVL